MRRLAHLTLLAAILGSGAWAVIALRLEAGAATTHRVTLIGLASDSAALATTDSNGVRYCAYVPGESIPAQMPPEVTNPPPRTPRAAGSPPAAKAVPSATTAGQLGILDALWDAVNGHYAYPDFRGRDWAAIRTTYRAMVEDGLDGAGFAVAMQNMLDELGDEHSYYQSPQAVQAEEEIRQKGQNYTGIGVFLLPLPGARGAVISVFPGSPAMEAGLRPHDLLLEVDGGPIMEADGTNHVRGPAGSSFTLRIQRPGEEPRTLTLTRRAISGSTPIEYCLVRGTRIGYILVPTLADETIDDQVRTALQKMVAGGPLQGLVIDNRVDGGGSSSVAKPLLGFFTNGLQGRQVSRDGTTDFTIAREDIGNSQSVPLVVLAGPDTVSFGDITTGVLARSGRAIVAGAPTRGNAELLTRSDFSDASRAWIATFVFQPVGLAPGAWEGVGVLPSVSVPTRWDLFNEATDPALAKAVELLLQR